MRDCLPVARRASARARQRGARLGSSATSARSASKGASVGAGRRRPRGRVGAAQPATSALLPFISSSSRDRPLCLIPLRFEWMLPCNSQIRNRGLRSCTCLASCILSCQLILLLGPCRRLQAAAARPRVPVRDGFWYWDTAFACARRRLGRRTLPSWRCLLEHLQPLVSLFALRPARDPSLFSL